MLVLLKKGKIHENYDNTGLSILILRWRLPWVSPAQIASFYLDRNRCQGLIQRHIFCELRDYRNIGYQVRWKVAIPRALRGWFTSRRQLFKAADLEISEISFLANPTKPHVKSEKNKSTTNTLSRNELKRIVFFSCLQLYFFCCY